MTAAYLQQVAAALGVPLVGVRFDHPAAASGPSILWRADGRDGEPTLDGLLSLGDLIQIECRSPTPEGARNLAADLLDRFRAEERLDAVIEEYDAPDSASLQRQHVFIRALTVRLR